MKNYEKYADEIKGHDGFNFCGDFILPYILKQNGCGDMDCDQCKMLQMLWLLEDYKEPEIDWSKVEVDTPILVRNSEYQEWNKRYFAGYGDGHIYAWNNGSTSWTAYNSSDVTEWEHAKLAEDECEDGEQE